MIKYIDEEDLKLVTEEELEKAIASIPDYLLEDGYRCSNCVFFNVVEGAGRIVTVPIFKNEEDGYNFPDEDAKIDENGLYNGYMFVWAYNLDNPSFSEAGSAVFDYNSDGKLRRIIKPMQIFSWIKELI